MTDLANLFTDHKMSGRPIHAKYKNLSKLLTTLPLIPVPSF